MEKSSLPIYIATKLPIFTPNKMQNFRFTPEQYILLEMEYNRYTVYKDLVKSIEKLFKLNTSNEISSRLTRISQIHEYANTSRKLYENKNIFERFVLECINHGISPHSINYISNNNNTSTYYQTGIDYIPPGEMPDMAKCVGYLFFNKDVSNEALLKETPYFKKMISEYIEKKFCYTTDKLSQLLKLISHANYRFITMVNELYANSNKPGYFENIPCNLLVTDSENYIIRYRTYTKVINFKRYAKLIRNYDRPFPFDIIRMLLRYSIFDTSNQQWSIGITLYDEISSRLDIGFEMFASPLNFNMYMFCSLFLDTDKTFGSVGSFYDITLDKLLNMGLRGVFYNPPYLPLLMATTTRMCISLLDNMNTLGKDFTIVSFLPNWTDAEYIQLFIKSKYLAAHKVVQKGDYVLHEKDKGKIIRGTFNLLVIVLNSRKPEWDSARENSFASCFKDIINIMKDETRGVKVDN
mgnify:CR=1 FL=1